MRDIERLSDGSSFGLLVYVVYVLVMAYPDFMSFLFAGVSLVVAGDLLLKVMYMVYPGYGKYL